MSAINQTDSFDAPSPIIYPRDVVYGGGKLTQYRKWSRFCAKLTSRQELLSKTQLIEQREAGNRNARRNNGSGKSNQNGIANRSLRLGWRQMRNRVVQLGAARLHQVPNRRTDRLYPAGQSCLPIALVGQGRCGIPSKGIHYQRHFNMQIGGNFHREFVCGGSSLQQDQPLYSENHLH